MKSKTLVPFLDILFNLLLGVTALLLILPLKTADDPSVQQNVRYQIVMTWDGNADLDLWVQDPQERVAGFNNKEGGMGSLMSLNRDCLGARTTEVNEHGEIVNAVNEEIVSLRGTSVGEYVVNAHAFNLKGEIPPVKAKIKVVQIKPYKEIVVIEKDFLANGDEITFIRFSVDRDGNVTGLNELQISILQNRNSTGHSSNPPIQ
jgi:hypothetical protein